MKKMITIFLLIFVSFSFSQEYKFDYRLVYKSISKDGKNDFTQLVNSQNPNYYIFFFGASDGIYARLLDYDKSIGHTFHVVQKKSDSEFIYIESNKFLVENYILKNITTEELYNSDYDYKITFDYRYRYGFFSKNRICFKVKLREIENNLILNYPMDFDIDTRKDIFFELLNLKKGNYMIDKVIYDNLSLKQSSEMEKINLVIVLPKELNYIN